MSCNTDYASFMAAKKEMADIKTAGVRLWGMGIGVFMTGPIMSAYYSIRTQNWFPTLTGTAVAIVGVPLAAADLGVTTVFAAPATTIVMFAKSTMKKRDELQILTPEQADCLLWEKTKAG